MTETKKIINRLRLRPLEHESGERHASWLELFFDLVFVLVFSARPTLSSQRVI
jgi:low temperature requirement protein LtrA